MKIPRDAARPKLEDLQDWQADLPSLPFQPEEEDTLEDIVSCAQEFRDFIRPYTNPVMVTPDEVTTQRFYLRKIEGADILLAFETNFFRQELHKWAPVAPEPPPILEISLSTRKPRPTKQQKMMAQLGIDNPEDLPQQFRAKHYTFKSRKSSDAHSTKAPQPLQPAPQFARGTDTSGSLPHSASTGATISSRGTSQRLPQPISTGHSDSTYSAYFPAMSPQSGQPHGDFGNPSPPFTWQNRPSNSNQSPALVDSPIFRPSTPSQGSGPPLDPGLFSPTTHHFAASALRMVSVAPSPGSLVSPMRDNYGSGPSNSGTNMDSIFADFTTVADDQSRNEAGEALEGLDVGGGSQEDDDGRPLTEDY